jgi:hypothetical protein
LGYLAGEKPQAKTLAFAGLSREKTGKISGKTPLRLARLDTPRSPRRAATRPGKPENIGKPRKKKTEKT